jgi:hypothetical protein
MRIRNYVMLTLGVSALALGSSAAYAKKAQLIPIVPYPDATTTTVFGISDDGSTIAGSYISGTDGLTHGFYGTIDGTYTSFDFDASGFTQIRAISGDGTALTGFSNNDGVHCDFSEFELTLGKKGKNAQIAKGKALLNGEVQGIAGDGTFAGDYCDTKGSGNIFGETGKSFKWKSQVTTPFTSVYTGERGINSDGTTVGFYVDSDTNLQVGTIIVGGTTTQVTYPDDTETYTVMEGINDAGLASGQWDDTSGIVHGFSYDTTTSTFTEIDDPNAASFTQPWGVNKSGLIAVSSDVGAYIYCTLSKKKCPVTGEAPIEVEVKTTHVAPNKLFSQNAHKAGAKHALPKGAALQ